MSLKVMDNPYLYSIIIRSMIMIVVVIIWRKVILGNWASSFSNLSSFRVFVSLMVYSIISEKKREIDNIWSLFRNFSGV